MPTVSHTGTSSACRRKIRPAASTSCPGGSIRPRRRSSPPPASDHHRESAMTWFSPVTLQDDRVALVPLDHAHAAALTDAAKAGALWQLRYPAIPAPEKMTADTLGKASSRER